jgi:hypothetical protein
MNGFRIRQALADNRETPAVPPADEFWRDFRARARLVPQQEAAEPARPPLLGIPAWTTVGVCALLLLAAGLFFVGRDSGAEVPPTQIHSLRVLVPHTAVLMMYDPTCQATILWVDDMDDGEETGA